MSNIFESVMSCVWLAVWRSKNFNVGHYTQNFQPVCFIPGMPLIGTIDLYHPIPLSLTSTLAGGLEVSTKQYILAKVYFLAQFLTDQHEI